MRLGHDLTLLPLGEYHDLCRREEATPGLSLVYYPPKTSLFWNALSRLGGFFVPQTLRNLLTGATAMDEIFEQAARKVGAFIYPASFAGMNGSEFEEKMMTAAMYTYSSSALVQFHRWADRKLGFGSILQVPDDHLAPGAFHEGAAFLLAQPPTLYRHRPAEVAYVEFFHYNLLLSDNVEQHWFAGLTDSGVQIVSRTERFELVGAPERPLARVEEIDFPTHGTIPSVEQFLCLVSEKRDEQSWPDFLIGITDPAFPLISILEEERPTTSLQLLPPLAQEKLVHHLRNLNKS